MGGGGGIIDTPTRLWVAGGRCRGGPGKKTSLQELLGAARSCSEVLSSLFHKGL